MKKIFLLYPIFLILSIFLLDKIFLLPIFQERFLQTGNVVYYRHREILFEKIKERKKDSKKIILGMGDSRAYSFSNLAFTKNKENPERQKKYDIYNFSGPQAVPAYSLFWIEKMIEEGIKIDRIFLVLSPEGFDDSKSLMHKPFLRLGASESFINQYRDKIPETDLNEYFLDQLFALRKIELDYKLLLQRIKSGNMKEYNPAYNPEMIVLNLYNGEQLAYANSVNDTKRLEADSIRMGNIYFYNFQLHETQFYFTEKILELCSRNQIQIDLLWMKVYPKYRENFTKYDIEAIWWKRIEKIANQYNMKTYDFNKIGDCELYYDASHQSAYCYYEYINFLVDQMEKKDK
jgi:hypothetical protein